MGINIRRQFNIDYYIVDFYCETLKLIIEVDGSIHEVQEVEEKDQRREKYLKIKGYSFLRFSNEEIFDDVERVVGKIRDYIESRDPSAKDGKVDDYVIACTDPTSPPL